ncbi:hypothetical protein HGG76_25940 [Ochrobactrum tritici]|uniref:Uncharacterized protein n=1 Tax=Brucella tritici TaxID=94626 RepID=A0A7X6FSU7_9HYPH|nr:hypothetical protein [Brucella tritici]
MLRAELRCRLLVARNALFLKSPGSSLPLQEKLGTANDDANKQAMLVKILHQTSRAKAARIQFDIPASYQLLFAVSALPSDTTDENKKSMLST